MPSPRLSRLAALPVAAAVALPLIALAPAQAAPTAPSAPSAVAVVKAPVAKAARYGGAVYAVGDSVMLGAAPQLRARGITVNAAVSRQASAAASLIAGLPSRYKRVIVHLGTNGTIGTREYGQVMRAAKGRTVYWVTVQVPRSWEAANNRFLRTHVKATKTTRDKVIDWNAASEGKRWFCSDGYHISCGGATPYANLLNARARA